MDVGVQADIAEQDRSPRATYTDAVKSPTLASKVTNSVPRQSDRSTVAAGSCTSTGKMSRKDRKSKNDVKSSIPTAHDVIKPDVKAKSLSQSSNGTRKEINVNKPSQSDQSVYLIYALVRLAAGRYSARLRFKRSAGEKTGTVLRV